MKPEDVSQEAWDEAERCELDAFAALSAGRKITSTEFIARAIMAAKAEEREAIRALLAHGAAHSPRRYIYDNTADRRIWACDKLDEAIRQRGTS